MTDTPRTNTQDSPQLERYTVRIVANPNAGKDEPFLGHIAAAFGESGVRWNVDVTNGPGEEAALAKRAVDEGAEVVVAFGGDGTVSAVADAIAGTDAVLGIIPGGTGNVFARELGIPLQVADAAQLLAGPHEIREVDLGMAELDDGTKRTFILRVSVGLEAAAVEESPREAKEKLGDLAYVIAGIRQMQDPPVAQYRLEDDGGHVAEIQGLFAVLANSGHIGVGEARYAPDVRIDDGLLDGLIAPAAASQLVAAAAAAFSGGESENIERLTGAHLRLTCDPPQRVTVDGEIMGDTPVSVTVRPRAVRVIAPLPAEETAPPATDKE